MDFIFLTFLLVVNEINFSSLTFSVWLSNQEFYHAEKETKESY